MRQDGKPFHFEFDRDWKAGPHTLTIEVQPLTPGEKQVRSLSLRIQSATVRGPMDERYWVRPPDYGRFFPAGRAPGHRRTPALCARAPGPVRRAGLPPPRGRRDEGPARGAGRALSRPRRGRPFEAGVAQAMAAVLTSPRFLFREEVAEPGAPGRYPLIDEYALASRLSYFLWSSMPDAELIRLAGEHKLRDEPARPRSIACSPTRGRRNSSATSSASGCRRATSRRCSSTRSP